MPDKKLQVNDFQHYQSGCDSRHERTGSQHGIDQEERMSGNERHIPDYSHHRRSNHQRVDYEGYPTRLSKLSRTIKQESNKRHDDWDHVNILTN